MTNVRHHIFVGVLPFFDISLFASFFLLCSFLIPKASLTLRVCADLSVREECDEDPNQSDEAEAEMSPPKSPSTPKNVKAKNSGTVHPSVRLWSQIIRRQHCVRTRSVLGGALNPKLALTSWLLLSAVLSI